MSNKWLWVVAMAAVGLVQAWDSGVMRAGGWPAVLALMGIGAPLAAIAFGGTKGVKIGTLVAGALLLIVARMVSPVPLNTLHLALFPAALYILVFEGLKPGASKRVA